MEVEKERKKNDMKGEIKRYAKWEPEEKKKKLQKYVKEEEVEGKLEVGRK